MTCVNRVRSRLNIGKDTDTTTVPVVWEHASKILKTEETRRECNEVTYVNWIPSRHKHIHVCAPLTVNLHKFFNERCSPQWYTDLEQNKTEQTHSIVCSRIRRAIYVVKLPRGSESRKKCAFIIYRQFVFWYKLTSVSHIFLSCHRECYLYANFHYCLSTRFHRSYWLLYLST